MVRLVRLPMDELKHRRALRQKYFEDPNYRKWSDILPGGMNDFRYMSWGDHQLFDYCCRTWTSTWFVRNKATWINL